jgi:hypothetical protein
MSQSTPSGMRWRSKADRVRPARRSRAPQNPGVDPVGLDLHAPGQVASDRGGLVDLGPELSRADFGACGVDLTTAGS